MKQAITAPSELVRTEAEMIPPPDVTVPEPAQGVSQSGRLGEADPALLRDIRDLAMRVGGLEKLKEMIDLLLQFPR